jgi:hypothetical protein
VLTTESIHQANTYSSISCASAKGINGSSNAVPEHTVGLCVPLVNTIVEARLRVTVPEMVAAVQGVDLKLLLYKL